MSPEREMTLTEQDDVLRLGEATPWADAEAVDDAIDIVLSERER